MDVAHNMALLKEKNYVKIETSSIAESVNHIFMILLTVLVALKKQNPKKILLN